jgi:hypothetical protein
MNLTQVYFFLKAYNSAQTLISENYVSKIFKINRNINEVVFCRITDGKQRAKTEFPSLFCSKIPEQHVTQKSAQYLEVLVQGTL